MYPVDLKAEGFKNVIVLAEDQPEYQVLSAIEIKPGLIWTRWQLTKEEQEMVANGARVELFTWTFQQPFQPVQLSIEGIDIKTKNMHISAKAEKTDLER